MQLAYVVNWILYSIYQNLKDNFLLQLPTWADTKTTMFYYYLPQEMNMSTNYDKWNWMQRETPADWTETSTPEIFKETRLHMLTTQKIRRQNNFYTTLYQIQHVYKQMQYNSKDELHFETGPVPIWLSVPLNEDRNLYQNEHCIVCVPIQPSVQ